MIEAQVMPITPSTIDEYIAGFKPEIQAVLRKIRSTVRKAAPAAQAKISYRIPCFAQDGVLVFFAAFKNHIGLFPPVRGDAKLMRAVSRYAGPKGNLRFPLDESIPYALIARIVKARVKANRERMIKKK